jgi:hypothetical protein
MRKRLPGLLLLVLLIPTAPGCRVLAGAAAVAGEITIEALLEESADDDRPAKRQGRSDRAYGRRPSEARR